MMSLNNILKLDKSNRRDPTCGSVPNRINELAKVFRGAISWGRGKETGHLYWADLNKSEVKNFEENFEPDIQNCHSRHAPSQPSVELYCSLAYNVHYKQKYRTNHGKSYQSIKNQLPPHQCTWLFWEGQNKWNPCRSWLCPPHLKCPRGTRTPWQQKSRTFCLRAAKESTWDSTVWRVEGAKACASHLLLVTTCVEQRLCLQIPSKCQNKLSHTQDGHLVLPWRLQHIVCPRRNPLLPIHQYFHLRFENMMAKSKNTEVQKHKIHKCTDLSLDLSKVWNGSFSFCSWQCEAPSDIAIWIISSLKIKFSQMDLNFNLNLWSRPAKTFAHKRVTSPVPSVKLPRQVQGARWDENRENYFRSKNRRTGFARTCRNL